MKKIKKLSQLDLNGTYNYAEYYSWQFPERVELFKGKIHQIEYPGTRHQLILGRLGGIIYHSLPEKKYHLFNAPFDVRMNDGNLNAKNHEDFFTVVQPDICVFIDKNKLDERGAFGAPELAVEILIPGNTAKEMRDKKDLYAMNGVKEYWIVNFVHEQVFQFVLNENGVYNPPIIRVSDDILECALFPELKINLVELFAE